MVHECFKKVNKFKNVQKGTVKVQDGSRWFNKVQTNNMQQQQILIGA